MAFPRWLARSNKYLANRVLIRLAERPPFAAIRHVGRRSGTEYRIPINTFRLDGEFVIALTYGPEADWVKNVVAAGSAVIEHGGVDVPVANPRLVGRADAIAAFPGWARAILAVAGVQQFLRLEEA